MQEASYQVVFNGATTEEYNLATTKKRFAKAFKLSLKKTERLFSGKDHVLKTNISEEDALKFAVAIANVGCECYIEPVPHEDDISKLPGFVERRRGGERRVNAPRRKTARPASINPDRRKTKGRRRTDLPPDQ